MELLVLITYDVSTQSAAGRKRLRKVAKECVNYGQRVQNSVFECILDSSQLLTVKDKLMSIIDEKEDSLRFYNLGNKYQHKVEHFGVKESYDAEGTLMI
jgi:CRISPR-associated protein Cas2